MKYILVILICFFSLFSYGQVQKQPRSNFPTVVDSSLAIGKNFIFPVFRSFQQLSQYQVLDSTGRVVFIRDSNALFLRTNQHTWQKIASAATTGVPGGQQYSIQTNDGSGGFYGDDLLLYNNLTGNIDVNVIGTVNLKPEGYVRINAFNEPTGFSNLIFDGLTKEVAPRNGYIIGTNDTGEVVKLVANGLSGSVLTNDGNNNLSWIGGSGTSTGIDSLTVTTTSICYWIDGVPTCLPAIGAGVDSITIVGDQWCQWLGGVSNCYTISGDTIVVGSGIDSVTVTGNIICWYPSSTPGEPVCASVDNAGNYIDSASLSSDSLEYNFYSSGVFRFSLPTLLNNLFPGQGIYISDTTISGNPYVAIYNTSQISTPWNYLVSAPTPTLTDSTVSVIPDIIFYMNGVKDTITTTTDYVINSVAPGYKKYILIYITPSQTIDTLWGNTDTSSITFPTVPDGGIALTHILVQGDTITVATPVTGVPVWHQGGDTASNPTLGTKNNLPINFITNNQLRAYISSVGNWVQAPRAISADEADSYQLQFLGWGTAGVQQYMVVGLDGVGGVNSGAGYFETNGFLKFSAANGYVQWLNSPNFDGLGSFNINARSASAGVSIGNATRQTSGNLFRIYNTSQYDVSRNINKAIYTSDNPSVQYLMADSADAPHVSAFAEWRSVNKGFLIPRLTGVQMTSISTPATGLLLYNTDSTAFCYYNGSAWVKIGGGGSSGSFWGLTGNSGLDTSINFLGTTDNTALLFKVNNIKSGLIDPGNNNTSYGWKSLLNQQPTNEENVAIGQSSQETSIDGYANTSVGWRALFDNISGNNNTAIGHEALAQITGDYNTGIGQIAGYNLTTGSNNTFLGANSGTNNPNMQGGTAVGFNSIANSDNTLILGDTINTRIGIGGTIPQAKFHVEGDGSLSALFTNGNVGIGTTNPVQALDVNGDTRFRANGTPGTGKVATGTDGLGNWTWQINSAVSTLQLTDSLNKIRDSISAHNIRIGANTTALAKFSDGTWQPTITSVANLDAVSINVCSYIKTDSVVTISGRFTFDPTSGGQTLTRARFTLPPGISSNFSDEWDAAGTATLNINTSGVNYGGIKADVTNDQIEIFFYPSTTTSFNYFFIGQFVIK